MRDPYDSIPTRLSLLSRIKNWGDEASWRDFFETYWLLIYKVALQSRLSESEAQDVVQETVLTVAKEIGNFKLQPERGGFKHWLHQIIRWRIVDQIRKRMSAKVHKTGQQTVNAWEEVEQVPDPSQALENVWETEWRAHLAQAVSERVKRQIKPKHYQVFDLHFVKGWPAKKVAETLNMSSAQVHLITHRVAALIKKQSKFLETEGF